MGNALQLTTGFARHQPQRFAAILDRAVLQDRSALTELFEILAPIPAADGAAVAASLAPTTLRDLANERAALLSTWLNAGSLDHAMTILARLPREQALALVSQVKRSSLQRRLRQFLNYPAHTVGVFAAELDLQLDASATVADALNQLRAATETPEQAVVVDASGKYLGVLDVWAIVVRGLDGNQPLQTVTRTVKPLRAEMPVSDAAWVDAWAQHSWLPVVDHNERILGWTSRSRLLDELAGDNAETSEMVGAVSAVFNAMLTVFVDMLTRILLPRSSR